MRTIARFCIVLGLMTFTSTLGFSQTAVVLLKGAIQDNASGSKVELTFKDAAGQSVRSSSAPDGSYQAVLKTATHYDITIIDDNLQRFTFQIDTPKSEKYVELKQDFSLKAPLPVAEKSVAKSSKKKTKAKKSTKGK